MKEQVTSAFIPNRILEYKSTMMILFAWIVMTFVFWNFSNTSLLSKPFDILSSAKSLIGEHYFLTDLLISTGLCIKAMFYAIAISYSISLLFVLPAFRPFVTFVSKARFLSTVGLTFIFAQVTSDTSSLKTSLLVFCIMVFLVTSFLAIIASVKDAEFEYARTLKLNEWESVWHIIIVGKADQFLDMIRQNFAIAWMMLAMVENLCRADGGIGVVLTDQNKHFHLDAVYAIQIIILLMGIFLDWFLGFLRRTFFPYTTLTSQHK
jgi:ABC-type nitrate/sulfonate/bicarbonate transport system permease component